MQGIIALCWMAEGFSKPYAYIPLRRLSFRFMSSKLSVISVQLLWNNDKKKKKKYLSDM